MKIDDFKYKLKNIKKVIDRSNIHSNKISLMLESLSIQLGMEGNGLNYVSVNPITVLKVIKEHFEVDVNVKTRKRAYARAREVASYLLKKYTLLSLKEIAEHIGLKDHTSALYHIRKVSGFLEIDKEFKLMMDELENKLTTYHDYINADNTIQTLQRDRQTVVLNDRSNP
jgi:chromosomal replication initiation ATPase DnaA